MFGCVDWNVNGHRSYWLSPDNPLLNVARLVVSLKQQIDATFGCMIFCLDIEPDRFEDNEEHILIVQFQIFYQFVWRVGKEALQTAEECVDFSVFHFLNKFRYLEIRFHTINR